MEGCVTLVMGYKQENNDRDQRLDWIEFPDEPDVEPRKSVEFDIWSDEMDQRADDLLKVSQLEAVIRKLRSVVNNEIDRLHKPKQKPAPLWLRILLHTPKNNKQTLMYHIGFGALMIAALFLFAWSMSLIS